MLCEMVEPDLRAMLQGLWRSEMRMTMMIEVVYMAARGLDAELLCDKTGRRKLRDGE